jgi:hypothetical protein
MKIIFRIVIILVITVLIAEAFNLAVGNGSSGRFIGGFEGGEGRRGSLGAGTLEFVAALIQIAAIVGLITAIQSGFKIWKRERNDQAV